MRICPLLVHQFAMPFEHRFRSEDVNHFAQLLDRLSRCAFQLNREQSESEFLGARHTQRFVQLSFDESQLSSKEEDLQVFGTIVLAVQK